MDRTSRLVLAKINLLLFMQQMDLRKLQDESTKISTKLQKLENEKTHRSGTDSICVTTGSSRLCIGIE